MRTVGSRELKNRLGRYLGLVGKGETIIVTDRGKPVARLLPPEPEQAKGKSVSDVLKELEAEKKPRLRVMNKVDLLEDRDEKVAAFLKEFTDFDRYFVISAINGEGCKELTYAIMDHLLAMNELEQQAAADSAQETDASTF